MPNKDVTITHIHTPNTLFCPQAPTMLTTNSQHQQKRTERIRSGKHAATAAYPPTQIHRLFKPVDASSNTIVFSQLQTQRFTSSITLRRCAPLITVTRFHQRFQMAFKECFFFISFYAGCFFNGQHPNKTQSNSQLSHKKCPLFFEIFGKAALLFTRIIIPDIQFEFGQIERFVFASEDRPGTKNELGLWSVLRSTSTYIFKSVL